MQRKLILMILIVSLALTAVACGSNAFDAKALADVRVTGADGYGTLTVKPDAESLRAIIEERASTVREDDEKALVEIIRLEAALNSLVYTAETTTGLSNGDEVKIRATYDESLAKGTGARFQNLSFIYKVEGLEAPRTIDVEHDVHLDLVGYNGRGAAKVTLSGDMKRFESFFDVTFASPHEDLSNGDVVDVRVEPDLTSLIGQGYVAEATTLSFDVSGLEDMTEVDLLADLNVLFEGISDQGVVAFDTTRVPIAWVELDAQGRAPVHYTANPSSELANGDVVEVTAEYDARWFENHGMIPVTVKGEYVVRGLKEYPRNLDDVSVLPLLKAIETEVAEDLEVRLDHNYWNDDERPGTPVSQWNYTVRRDVTKILYGYRQADRADNFVAVVYKVDIEGTCTETIPYHSSYRVGDKARATRYFVYVVDDVFYDRPSIDDYREVQLRLHGEVERTVVSDLKAMLDGDDMQIIEVPVPPEAQAIAH
ncbi:MAG: hypothetical protein ACOYH4_00680 [Saccharofermentanales bacterium]